MTTTTAAVLTTPAPKASLFATKEQYVAILTGLGLPIVEQSGFIKVQCPGGRLYIAATKTVRRIDLSGFELPLPLQLTKVPHCGPFGKVTQQMEVGTGPAGDLERFEEILSTLQALPAPVKVEKPKAPKMAKGEKKGWGATPKAPAAEGEEAKAARIALIKRVAAEKGLSVSSSSAAAEE